MLFLLPGCWNSKDIQNMAYVTAIGFDFEDGKFVTYAQILNFSNIAKSETSKVGSTVPVWIGKGEGVTVTESFNNIYATSQLRIFWGHVKSIVLTERFIKQGGRMQEAYDMVNRYREIRYNILMYGTKEPLRNIFVQKSLFNLSPLESLLATPNQMYSQRSYILPVYGYKIIAHIKEPGQSAMLPSLSLENGSWTEDHKPRRMFKIDGAYYFNHNSMVGWLSEKDLEGYRWLQKKLERSPINIPNDAHPAAALVMIKPKPHIYPVLKNGKIYYNIHLSIKAYVDEMVRDMKKEEIEEQAAQVIRNEIRETYNKGLRINVDVLQLGEQLYRNHPKVWRQQSDGEFALTPESLDRIDVKVKLLHTGKYKDRVD